MTLLKYAMNTTDGATATVGAGVNGGNTGGYTIASAGTSSQTMLLAAAYEGSTGLRCVADGTNSSNIRWKMAVASATQGAFSIRFRVPSALPTANHAFWQINDSTVTRILQLQYRPDGTVRTYDKGGVAIVLLTAAQAVPGTWFRLEMVVTTISATTGAFTVRAYSTGSTQVGVTASSTTANLGSSNIAHVAAGIVNSGFVLTQDLDDVQLNDGSTVEIGELTVNATPPTIVAGANQTISTTGIPVNLTCTATPAAGSAGIASYQWTALAWPVGSSAPTITNPTTQSPTFTPSVTGRFIFGVTATDAESNTSSQATTRVFLPDVQVQVIEVTSNTGFTVGAIAADLSDLSDLTYVDSGAPGLGNVLTARLKPMISTATGFSVDIRSYVTTVSGTQKVALLEGGTVRKDWGTITPGTSAGDTILTLTTAEMATITSWNELDLRFTQV